MDNTLLDKQLEKKEYITKAQREKFLDIFLDMIEELGMSGVLMYSLTWCSKNSGQIVEAEDTLGYDISKGSYKTYIDSGGIFSEAADLSGIDGADFAYFTIMEEDAIVPYPRIHCLYGVRSFFGKNEDGLALAISKYLNEPHIKMKLQHITPLYTPEEQKEFVRFLFKDIQTSIPWHGFLCYSQINKEVYARFREFIFINNIPSYNHKGFPYGRYKGEKHDIKGYIPYASSGNTFDESILIYLWSLYLSMNNMIISNYGIYKKIPNTKYSYVYVDDVNWLSKNAISIMDHLRNSIKYQFDYVDIKSFISSNNKKAINVVKGNMELLDNKRICWDLIEFNDGIYHIKYNIFIPYCIIERELDKVDMYIGRYFPCSYRDLKSTIGQHFPWIDILYRSLDKKQVDMLCRSLGSIFMMNPIVEKCDNKYNRKTNELLVTVNSQLDIDNTAVDINTYENNIVYKEQLLHLLHRSSDITMSTHLFRVLHQSCLPVLLVGSDDNYESLIKSKVFDTLYLLKHVNKCFIDKKNNEIYLQIQKDLPTILIYCIQAWHKYYGMSLEDKDISILLNDIKRSYS